MQAMIWIGAAVTLAGVALLLWCVREIRAARAAGLTEDELRTRLMRAVMWNLVAMGASGVGLAMVIVGLLLG